MALSHLITQVNAVANGEQVPRRGAGGRVPANLIQPIDGPGARAPRVVDLVACFLVDVVQKLTLSDEDLQHSVVHAV